MGVVRYAVCDDCGDSEKRYMELKDREATNFKYEEIVDTNTASFAEVDGWLVRAMQDPEDPIAIVHRFYCPDCKSGRVVQSD